MKTAGVRELKAKLSAYLRDVERGEVVLVTDRGRVIAEIRRPGSGRVIVDDPGLQSLVERGLVRPAIAPGSVKWSELPSLGLPPGTAQALLDEDREDKW